MAADVRYRLIGPWGHFRLDATDDAHARLLAKETLLRHRTMIEPHHKPCRLIRVTQEEMTL